MERKNGPSSGSRVDDEGKTHKVAITARQLARPIQRQHQGQKAKPTHNDPVYETLLRRTRSRIIWRKTFRGTRTPSAFSGSFQRGFCPVCNTKNHPDHGPWAHSLLRPSSDWVVPRVPTTAFCSIQSCHDKGSPANLFSVSKSRVFPGKRGVSKGLSRMKRKLHGPVLRGPGPQ